MNGAFETSTFSQIVGAFVRILGLLIPLVMSLAFLVFIWGLAKFIFASGDEKAIEGGRRLMVGGIIALFVMISLWAIVAFLYGEFNIALPIQFPPQLPQE